MQQHDLIDSLIIGGQTRKFHIGIANRQKNAAGAFIRLQLGWRRDAPDAKDIVARAARIGAAGLARKPYRDDDAEAGARLDEVLEGTSKAINVHEDARHGVELRMKRAVRLLPVAAWAKSVRGLGELGLAVIVAEAGDFAVYSDVRKLWKRLGLAPFEGKAYSTWRREGGLGKDDWIAAGYSPRRRAEVFACVGEPLLKHQTMVGGPYRKIYDVRRARTAETHPEWSDLHSHLDGMRIMTKKLIFDLWSEWRRPNERVEPCASEDGAASADIREAA